MLCPWGAVDTLVDSVSLNRSQHECSWIGPPLSRRNKYSYRSLCVLVSESAVFPFALPATLVDSILIPIIIKTTENWDYHLMHHLLCKLFFTENCLLWPFWEWRFQMPGHFDSSPFRMLFEYLSSEFPKDKNIRGVTLDRIYLNSAVFNQRREELTLPREETGWSTEEWSPLLAERSTVQLDLWSRNLQSQTTQTAAYAPVFDFYSAYRMTHVHLSK